MPNRPLLALAVLTCLGSAFFLEIHATEGELLTFGAVAILALTAAWIFGRIRLIRGAAALLLSCWIVWNVPFVWTSSALMYPNMPGRVEGTIRQLKEGNNGRRSLIIKGEIDLRSAPAAEGQVFLLVSSVHNRQKKAQSIRELPNGELREGDRVVAFGEFGPFFEEPHPALFNAASWARSASLSFTGRCEPSAITILSSDATNTQTLHNMRTWVFQQLSQSLSRESAAIMQAMITGDRSKIPRELSESFADAGVAHILSVSGSHVGLILSIIISVIGPLARSWKTTLAATLLLLCYVVFTGFEPPTIRSVLMAIGALIGRIRERDVDAHNLLGGATLLVLMFSPSMITNASFLLSAIATYGILSVVPCWSEVLPGPFWLRSILALNLSASGIMAVPGLLVLESLPIAAPLANLLVVPMLSFALAAGMLFLPFSNMPAVAPHLAWWIELLVQGASRVSIFIADITPSFSRPQSAVIACCYAALLLWPVVNRHRRAVLTRMLVASVWVAVLVNMSFGNTIGCVVTATNNGVRIVTTLHDDVRIAFIEQRYGAVFVRSYHGSDPARLQRSTRDQRNNAR